MPMHPHDHVKALLAQLDPYPDREGLRETPARFTAAMQHWTRGYGVEPASLLKTFTDGAKNYDEMVFVGSIPFYSMCEHHLAPFFGVAHVAYVPVKRIVGLSKIPRVVDAFAQRLTVQERITTEVCDCIHHTLKAKGTAVVLQARHMCMESRGVSKPGTITLTSALKGVMNSKPEARAEFMTMVAMQKGVGVG